MLGHREDAEDIAQQVLLKGFTDINRLRDSEQFGAWVGRIARNLCIDFIRRRKRKRNALVERTALSQSSSKEYPELEGALAKLPQRYRLALVLYYFDGRSTETIAETLAISQAAVRTRISRARKQLRKLLETEGGT
jgi:RNA polymerase sigma-70 factor (ECF subfamily)